MPQFELVDGQRELVYVLHSIQCISSRTTDVTVNIINLNAFLRRLHHLLHQLEDGEINSVTDMKDELSQAIAMMDIANTRDYR